MRDEPNVAGTLDPPDSAKILARSSRGRRCLGGWAVTVSPFKISRFLRCSDEKGVQGVDFSTLRSPKCGLRIFVGMRWGIMMAQCSTKPSSLGLGGSSKSPLRVKIASEYRLHRMSLRHSAAVRDRSVVYSRQAFLTYCKTLRSTAALSTLPCLIPSPNTPFFVSGTPK